MSTPGLAAAVALGHISDACYTFADGASNGYSSSATIPPRRDL